MKHKCWLHSRTIWLNEGMQIYNTPVVPVAWTCVLRLPKLGCATKITLSMHCYEVEVFMLSRIAVLVMWVQKVISVFLAKLRVFFYLHNSCKNTQIKIYLKSDVKRVLFLWAKQAPPQKKKNQKTINNKRNWNTKWFLLHNDKTADMTLFHSHDVLLTWCSHSTTLV